MAEMTAAQLVAAVREIQAERDELRRLLADVAAVSSGEDLPTDLVAEIQRRTA